MQIGFFMRTREGTAIEATLHDATDIKAAAADAFLALLCDGNDKPVPEPVKKEPRKKSRSLHGGERRTGTQTEKTSIDEVFSQVPAN